MDRLLNIFRFRKPKFLRKKKKKEKECKEDSAKDSDIHSFRWSAASLFRCRRSKSLQAVANSPNIGKVKRHSTGCNIQHKKNGRGLSGTEETLFLRSPVTSSRRKIPMSFESSIERDLFFQGGSNGELDISPASRASDQRSYFCYTTEDDDEEDEEDPCFIPPESLPIEVKRLRKQILEVLMHQGILTYDEAQTSYECPRDVIIYNRHHLLNNYLWLPENLSLGTCFMDFINYYCDDPEYLEELLSSPISVSHNDASSFFSTGKSFIVKDLINETDGKFYSFCLSRAVLMKDTTHCARCHACFDARYWHCNNCNHCSLGINIGTCEHCGYKDISDSSGHLNEASVDEVSITSVSQLQ